MWDMIADNQLDDPVLDVPHHHAVRDAAAKAAPAKSRRHAFCNAVVAIGRSNPRAFAKAQSLGLHFPLPSPATRPKRKNQIDAGATGQVLPPNPPNLPRGSREGRVRINCAKAQLAKTY